MHDYCLNDQPARTGCKSENVGGLPVWQPRCGESWYQELSNVGSAAF
eukprot:COSAG05_NODE_2112_length_3547_cov_1.596288_6_plen_47_part_00